MMYDIIPVDRSLAETPEQLGTKRKYWYRVGDRRLLFKAEERGTGDDWAEKVACELCALLGIPHVQYELAIETDTGTPGVICESCVKRPAALVLGNQVLLAIDPAYPAEHANKFKVKEHTVDAVAQAQRLLTAPPAEWMGGIPPGIETALDVFVGYVMLDAWIANQDRHHENWGVIFDLQRLSLAPTFDHGAAFARNITDDERRERLTTRDAGRQIEAFAGKARSAFFAETGSKKAMPTIDAWLAFAARAPEAAKRWLARLGEIDETTIKQVLERVPETRMSPVTRDFTLRLLTVNRQRLLDGDRS